MNLLFCYDGSIKKDVNNYYGISLNDNVFSNYQLLANSVSAAVRIKPFSTFDDRSKYSKISKKYTIFELPNIASLKGQLINKKKCIKELEKAILKHDIIIVRLPSFIGLEACKICEKNKKAYIIEVVSCTFDCLWYHSFRGKLVAPLLFYLNRKAIKKAKYVIYVSKSFLQSRYPNSNNFLSCSDVDLNLSYRRNVANRKKRLNKKEKIILGTIAPVDISYKGQKYVIKSLPRLLKKGFNVYYHLAGGGDKTKLLKFARKYGVANRIVFSGVIKHSDIFKWLETIDIYIQPSNAESHGRVIIEAMSTGCPCIGSSTGGIPELIDSQYVFKRKHYKDLVKKIVKMINGDITKSINYSYKTSLEYDKKLLLNKKSNFYNIFLNNEFKNK